MVWVTNGIMQSRIISSNIIIAFSLELCGEKMSYIEITRQIQICDAMAQDERMNALPQMSKVKTLSRDH